MGRSLRTAEVKARRVKGGSKEGKSLPDLRQESVQPEEDGERLLCLAFRDRHTHCSSVSRAKREILFFKLCFDK